MLTPNLSFDTMEEILRLKIAGSSDGIGAQTAFQFATEGANVTITGRRAQNLEVEKFWSYKNESWWNIFKIISTENNYAVW